jgi:uncharacterized membrane protein YcaP (DUF421 family)
MERLFAIEWSDLVVPTHSLAEMVVRGTLMYGALFFLFRFVTKRQVGSIGIADILLVVLIADAASNAFANEYRSLTEGIVLVVTIAFWDFVIDWASYRFPFLSTLGRAPPLQLVRDGKLMRRNMRKELVTLDELEGHFRKQGIDNLADVKDAYMEGDGKISVVRRE